MTHVSKHPLKEPVKKQIDAQLLDTFIAQTSPGDFRRLLKELFTPAEMILYAKRMAVIALLHKNCSAYEISMILKVSSSTVTRINRYRSVGRYGHIETMLERKAYRHSLLGFIESVLSAGMPPRGRGRWSRTFRSIDTWRTGGY